MIQYVRHKNIDTKKWDQCIANSDNAIIYARSWYLDAVSPGWDALIEDNYSSVFPLTHSRKYGIQYLRQPHFTQQLGVFSSDNITQSLIRNYLSVISERYRFVEINLNTGNRLASEDYKVTPLVTYHLNLNKDYETLFRKYSLNTRRNIAKAEKAELTLETDADEDEIIKLFKKNRGKDFDLKTEHYQVLQKIVKEARKRKAVQVIAARTHDDKVCAGAIFLIGLKKIIFLFSGTSAEARKNGAMSCIIDQVIKSNAGKDLILDFEGSMDKNLARFYSSFGSKEAVYLRIKRNKLPKFVRWIKS